MVYIEPIKLVLEDLVLTYLSGQLVRCFLIAFMFCFYFYERKYYCFLVDYGYYLGF